MMALRPRVDPHVVEPRLAGRLLCTCCTLTAVQFHLGVDCPQRQLDGITNALPPFGGLHGEFCQVGVAIQSKSAQEALLSRMRKFKRLIVMAVESERQSGHRREANLVAKIYHVDLDPMVRAPHSITATQVQGQHWGKSRTLMKS